MKMPRVSRSIFRDQLIWMMTAGLMMGVVFPPFLTLFGVPQAYVFTLPFYSASVGAGLMMGLLNYGLVHFVTRPALQQLAGGMEKVAHALEAQLDDTQRGHLEREVCLRPEDCMVTIRSSDELGGVAASFNQLVVLLRDSREVQQAYEAFTHQLSTSLELKDLTEKVLRLLGYYRIGDAMALYVQQEGELQLAFSTGIRDAEALSGHPLVERTARLKRSEVISLPQEVEVDALLLHFKPQEVEAVPILYKDIVEGVLVIARAAALTPRQQRIRDLFVEGLGLALHNALAHEKIQRIAVLDGLTGVFNRRFGMERLNEEYARAQRQGAPLTVLMADIDHFKSINDRYGHLVGDRAIKQVVNTIRSLLREGDVLVRYGGEEFLVLLPGASVDDAVEIAERIRLKVMESPLRVDGSVLELTISQGVAGIPEMEVNTATELVQRADEALYRAKESGRNRVVDARQLVISAQAEIA